MGLHAKIHQKDSEVSISLTGEFHAPEYDQLAEIVKHFRSRGCRQFVLDVRGVTRMNAATEATLRRLVKEPKSRSGSRNLPSAPSASGRITPQSGRRRTAGILFSEMEVTEF